MPQTDLLRRLENELGPAADALGSTKGVPRSVLSRALFRTFIAAVAMAAVLVLAWPELQREEPKAVVATTGSSTSANKDEISRLKESLANAEAANFGLREELEEAHSLPKTPKTPSAWFENTAGLTFRSPSPPKE